ncbi:MAG TPA: hypothetical protein VF717_09360 [Pyrinomonadaceae bacterium]|jgi:hypothetical protein
MADERDQQQGATEQHEPRTIWVRSALKSEEDGGNKVVLWEKDDAHPKGEILIAGKKPVEVAMTPAVSQLLRDGKIARIPAPKAESKPPATK